MTGLTYELAKELKDAGFGDGEKYSQVGRGVFYGNTGEEIISPPWYDKVLKTYVYAPTLSELIEAVKGDKMHTFSLDFNEEWSVYEEPNKDGPWSARYYDLTPVGFYECGAKTPEQAVKNLWIALNKPK